MLGHLEAGKTQQVGEPVESVRAPFSVVKEFEYLKG